MPGQQRSGELVRALDWKGDLGERKAGVLPYLALAGGAILVLWANWFFVLPS